MLATILCAGKLEEALVSHSTDTILFELVKFLLQSIFLIMEEEHETLVQLDSQERLAVATSTSIDGETAAEDGGRSNTGSNSIGKHGERGVDRKGVLHYCCLIIASRRSSIGSIPMEEIEERPLDVRLASLKESAAVYAKWPQLTQATPLHNLVLDPYTCTEVLRLHLLSCGGYQESGDRQWFRYCNRGGFSDSDDPALELRLNHQELLEELAITSIYDLDPEDKILVLSTLCSQLLVFASARDFLEDAQQQSKQVRKEIRSLQAVLVKKDDKKKTVVDNNPAEGEKSANEKDAAGEIQGRPPDAILVDHSDAISNATPTDTLSTQKTKESVKPQAESSKQQLLQEETKMERNERILKEIEILEEELYPLMATVNLKPLGFDRFFNRYWVFPSLAGLFVERSVWNDERLVHHHSEDVVETTQAPHTLDRRESILASTKNTISPSTGSAILHAPDSYPSPEPIDPALATNHLSSTWSCLAGQAELSLLLNSLNPRGEREVALQRNILRRKDRILSVVAECPVNSSAAEQCVPPPTESAEDYLQLYLREQILDIEEKIYIGNLGYVRNVGDRKVWRDALESPGAAANGTESSDDAMVGGHASTSSVQQLARVLLQIQEGIERKFLLAPLGTAIDTKKKGRLTKKNGIVKESELCVEQWRASLSKATSLAQVFVHLSTLERAVAWSKSLMNVRCRICRRKGGDEYMLLCDGCDHGYHTYCLRPPLLHIPDGDWFCYDCCPVTPVKRRRTAPVSFKEESSESELGSEEEVNEVEEQSVDASEEDSDVESKTNGVRSGMRLSTRVQRKAVGHPKIRSRIRRRAPAASMVEETRRRKFKTSAPPVYGVRKKLLMEDNRTSSNRDLSKAEVIISAIIDVRCSNKRRSLQKEQQSLELQLCGALLEELCNHPESRPFHNPVRRREVS